MTDMKPVTPDGKCPHCAGGKFTLCRDYTVYSVCNFETGNPVVEYDHEEFQPFDSHDPLGGVRLLCIECNEYLEVPEELKNV